MPKSLTTAVSNELIPTSNGPDQDSGLITSLQKRASAGKSAKELKRVESQKVASTFIAKNSVPTFDQFIEH